MDNNEKQVKPEEPKAKEKKIKKYKFKPWFYYLCKFFFGIVGLFYPTRIINKQNIHAKGRYIYAVNHLTLIDIPFTQIRMRGRRRYIGKKEFTEGALYPLVASFGVIFVDREKPEMSTLREIFGVLKEENGQILIFPEGTRNRGDYRELLPIKPGLAMFAAKSGVPVIPIILYKPCKPFRMNYMYMGSELTIPDNGGRLPPPAELMRLTEFYRYEMEKARIYAKDHIENKRWKKKNRLGEGVVPQLVLDWTREHPPVLLEDSKVEE